MNEEFYRKQIQGLLLILGDDSQGKSNAFITTEYVVERLNMILNGGIGFHPIIKEHLGIDEKKEDEWRRFWNKYNSDVPYETIGEPEDVNEFREFSKN
jgi:hypothetical protein